MNNRTHRELIVIDGTHGFIGGAGIAAHWDIGDKGKPPWRDMMYRVTGGLAQGLQTTFAENWLESSGEVLSDIAAFPPQDERPENPTDAMVVTSVAITTTAAIWLPSRRPRQASRIQPGGAKPA